MDLMFSFYALFFFFAHCYCNTGKYFGVIDCRHAETGIPGCEPSNECTVTCSQHSDPCNRKDWAYAVHGQRVYGTRVYASNSAVCAAAYHDYRISQHSPYKNVTYAKQCGNEQKLLSSIHQNVNSLLLDKYNCTFNFTTPFFSEDILDVATLNYQYLYQGNAAFIQSCQISDKFNTLDFQFYIPGSEKKNVNRKSTGWHETQWTKPNLQPGGFWCIVQQHDYSGVMSLAMASNADFVPEQWTITTSIYEKVVIKFSQRDKSNIQTAVMWRKNQNPLYSFSNMKISQNKSDHFLEIDNVDVGDAGIYSLEFFEEKERQGILRLIVRKCPKNYFGRKCNRICPDCRNGGVCHDVMGDCICPPGFNGTNCENRCATGYFGRSCSLSCISSDNAIANSCKSALICLPDPYGCSCAAGYKGLACNDRLLPSVCDQQKVAVCNIRHQKFENCGKVKAYRDCLTITASCPAEQMEKIIKQVMILNSLDCGPFDIDRDKVIETTCQKSLQEKSFELLEEMQKRMQEDRDVTLRFQGEILQLLQQIATTIFNYDNLPLKKD